MVPKPMTIGDNDETHDVPLLRNRQGLNDVVNDGNECAVIEERDKHQHEHREQQEVGPRFARDLLMKIIFPGELCASSGAGC